MRKTFFFVTCILFLVPIAMANGGDQRVIDNFLVSLSRAPFTPATGDNVSMLISFVDLEKGRLINETLLVKIKIVKLGEDHGFDSPPLPVSGGVLEFSYIFPDPGIHEIFVSFSFVSDPQKTIEAPDFLLDIQKKPAEKNPFVYIFIGIAIGVLAGWILGKRI